ncbi:hypothetical protein OAB00_01220 [Akkermansiaceae bacterium]|nr:hypothetical protein [Akkermansiaceae bacterium]
MAFNVEDGTIVDFANSFCTVEDARSFADSRGLTLPTDDTQVEQFLVQATDFISTLESRFQGTRSDVNQELSFPRDNIEIYGNDASGLIPTLLKHATARLAYDVSTGVDLQATTTGQSVLEEGVGALRVKYVDQSAVTGSADAEARFTAAMNLLEPLFDKSSSASNGGFITHVTR